MSTVLVKDKSSKEFNRVSVKDLCKHTHVDLLTDEQRGDVELLPIWELMHYCEVLDEYIDRYKDIIKRYGLNGAAFDNKVRRRKI